MLAMLSAALWLAAATPQHPLDQIPSPPQTTIDAVRTWRYKPGRQNGRAVRTILRINVGCVSLLLAAACGAIYVRGSGWSISWRNRRSGKSAQIGRRRSVGSYFARATTPCASVNPTNFCSAS